MSEQNKSNAQVFGAGLLGFVVAAAIGAGVMIAHSSLQSKSSLNNPAPAAAPIDLGAATPRSAPLAPKEGRAQSPSPLLGEEAANTAAPAASASAANVAAASPAAPAAKGSVASAAESAPRAKAPALAATAHLDASSGGSAPTAVPAANVAAAAPAPQPAAKDEGKKAVPKLVPTGTAASIASIHYGVTSRSELMGRASGTVNNFKGGGGKADSAATGKMADDTNAKIAELQRQLKEADLPADQRAKLQKEFDDASKLLVESPKTAQ